MDPTLQEWLNLALRWMHVIAGIAWIGTSFFFNWLDARMSPPKKPTPGVDEEMWLVHSGGFYVFNKLNRIRPDKPTPLGADAMATWVSGMLLLIVVFYFSASLHLVDPQVADLGVYDVIIIGLGTIVVSWVLYDEFWKTRFAIENPTPAIVISCIALVVVTYFLHQVMSGRGAYVHVGVLMGTIMWANVRVRILPAQIKMISETGPDEQPNLELEARAKRRSLHNNYMTLPVLIVMVSGHFPATYGHEYNWLILLSLFAVGAAARHAFNLENYGQGGKWPLLGGALAGLVAISLIVSPISLSGGDSMAAEEDPEIAAMFQQVRLTITKHCTNCPPNRPPTRRSSNRPKASFSTRRV